MPSSPPYSASILAAGCVALLAAAVYTSAVEIGPAATQELSERGTVRAMAAGMLAPALSIRSQIDFLLHCRIAMTSLTGRAQPTTVRTAILDTCGSASEALVAASPGFSAAWYTGALVASFTGDPVRMNHWLEQSYATGPFEQWIAELRVDLAEDNFLTLNASLADRHMADLKMLLSNDGGRRFLAPRYLVFARLREHVDLLLTQQDEAGSRRFLNIVDRLRVERSRTNGR